MATAFLDGTRGKGSPLEMSTEETSGVHKVTPPVTDCNFPEATGLCICPLHRGKPGCMWALWVCVSSSRETDVETLSRWTELSPVLCSIQRLWPTSTKPMKVFQAFAEVNQKVWRNPRAGTNKDNIFSGTCPLLFRSYVSDHLLTLSNSFLGFFISLLLLSESAPLNQLAAPTPKLQIMILVWYFTVMSRTSCPCCRHGAKPAAPAWMQRGLSPLPLPLDKSHKQASSCLHINAALPPTLLSAHHKYTLLALWNADIHTSKIYTPY